MPQASDELRQQMRIYFGDSVCDREPMRYLSQKGFTFPRGGLIVSPPNRTVGNICVVSKREWDCLLFLCDEWDHVWEFSAKVSTV